MTRINVRGHTTIIIGSNLFGLKKLISLPPKKTPDGFSNFLCIKKCINDPMVLAIFCQKKEWIGNFLPKNENISGKTLDFVYQQTCGFGNVFSKNSRLAFLGKQVRALPFGWGGPLDIRLSPFRHKLVRLTPFRHEKVRLSPFRHELIKKSTQKKNVLNHNLIL